MKEILLHYYGLKVIAYIKISERVFRLKADNGDYALKYLDDNNTENTIARLNMLKLNFFLIPLKNVNNSYITYHEGKYFHITNWCEDEQVLAKDIRLRHYLNRLADLHNNSFYTLKVNEGFYSESYSYIENLIDIFDKRFEKFIGEIEQLGYKSPSQWLIIMNGAYFKNAVVKSKEFLEKFKEETKNKNVLRVALTHQNFDYTHVLVKYDKILSLRKMTITSPVYDIKHLFDNAFSCAIDINNFFQEYLGKFKLSKYEKEWLKSLICIPNTNFNQIDEITSISEITIGLHKIKSGFELIKLLEDNKQDEE